MVTPTPAHNWFDPSSRYSLHEVPLLAPGSCFICKTGSGDERTFIDAKISFKWYGAVYFCSFCVKEMARGIGLVSAELVEIAMENNDELVAENIALRGKVKDANESQRAMARTLSDCTCGSDGPYSEHDEIDESAANAESTDSESDESGGVEGSGSIHDAGDDSADE